MAIDISTNPYFDDYDPSKQYTQIIGNPGRGFQAREFTQAQTLLKDLIKRLSDSFYKDGDIISGMGFNIDSANSKITIHDGMVYLEGKVLVFKQQQIDFAGTGTENVGVKVIDSIVTSDTDNSLLDPALGVANTGKIGADRIQSVPVVVINDDKASTIYEFVDGLLQTQVSTPQADKLMETLAKRTYEESGNYRVSGYELTVQPYDANNVQVVIEPGIAYVDGYRIMRPTPLKKIVPMSKDVRSIQNEPKTYVNGTSAYKLNNQPVSAINRVVAEVQKSATMTRGAVVDGMDALPNSSVVSIVSVTQGGTTYVSGTDYQLTTDSVDWGLSGAEPAVGTTYTVVYNYNKTMVAGTDYELSSSTDIWGNESDTVTFLSGDTPVSNTSFNIDYSFFLARYDLFSLDKDGNVIVDTGGSDIPKNAVVPVNKDPNVLTLGSVYYPPDNQNAVPTASTITRLDMSQLQSMALRLNDVEYNQAITALDHQAMEGESPTNLKGVFSDSFRSTSKGDLTNPLFTVAYSLEDGQILLPPNNISAINPTINITNSDAKIWGRLITAPMTEVVSITQPYATTTMKVNPYLAFNSYGVLNLNPRVYNWLDTSKITIEDTEFEAAKLYRWWRHGGRGKSRDASLDKLKLDNGLSVSDWRPGYYQTGVAIKTEKSRQIIEEAITYMKQITVSIDATNLEPNTDNLALYFDDVKCNLTPSAGYSAGTNSGTVKSNASGEVKATFTIPPNIKTGTREVILSNASNTATTSFTSIGTKETVIDKVITTRINITAVDPLAQTFQFKQNTVLTSIGFYIGANDTNPLHIQIRDVVNGYPGSTIYAEKVLQSSQVNVSLDSSAETKVTFDDPIFCKANTQYCMVLLTDSATTNAYIADLGKNDILTGNPVNRQPYLAGMLFSSSNGIAWTAQQSMNLKFNIYTAQFNDTGVIEFDPINGVSADKILMLADYLTPSNTGCAWEMSLNGGAFQPIVTFEDINLASVASTIQLKATFRSDTNMSPLIAKDSFNFVSFLTATSATYVSRNVTLDQDITNVRMGYEAHIPEGCTVTPQFSTDNGATWVTPTLSDQKQTSTDFTQYNFTASVDPALHARQYRARINISANSSVLRPSVRNLINIMT